MTDIFKIALGVMLGGLLLYGGRALYESMQKQGENNTNAGAAVRTYLRNWATHEEAYKSEHGRYTGAPMGKADMAGMKEIGVDIRVLGAGEDWWMARGSMEGASVECLMYEGEIPLEREELQEILDEFEAADSPGPKCR